MLNKDVSKLSDRVSDYNEIEAHNNDLQSELFSRDRFVLSSCVCRNSVLFFFQTDCHLTI